MVQSLAVVDVLIGYVDVWDGATDVGPYALTLKYKFGHNSIRRTSGVDCRWLTKFNIQYFAQETGKPNGRHDNISLQL